MGISASCKYVIVETPQRPDRPTTTLILVKDKINQTACVLIATLNPNSYIRKLLKYKQETFFLLKLSGFLS